MTLSLDTRPDEAPVTEPPRRWRNWFRVTWHQGYWCGRCDAELHPGQTYRDCSVFPSKDVAESAARLAMTASGTNIPLAVHLGAFPEGERP